MNIAVVIEIQFYPILLGVTINAHFDYNDSITIAETTITILSLSWHTIMILSRYYQVFSTMILKHGLE